MKRFNRAFFLVLSTVFVAGCSVATTNNAIESEITQPGFCISNHSITVDTDTVVKHWKYGNAKRHG